MKSRHGSPWPFQQGLLMLFLILLIINIIIIHYHYYHVHYQYHYCYGFTFLFFGGGEGGYPFSGHVSAGAPRHLARDSFCPAEASEKLKACLKLAIGAIDGCGSKIGT